MRFIVRVLPLAIVAAVAMTPLASGSAHATGCDTNPGDAVSLSWTTGRLLAANGTLAKSSSAQSSVMAYNSSGACVQGAQVSMTLRAVPGGGSVVTSTTGCPFGSVGPNVSTCTTDGNGSVPISYTTPSALPNDGTDYVDAWLSSSSAAQTTSYTYGSVRVTGNPVSAVEGSTFTGALAIANLYNFAVIPAVQATISWDDGTTSPGTVTGPAPGSAGPAAGTYASLTISGSHSYPEESANAIPVHVTLTAMTTATVVATASVTVADASLAATGSSAMTLKRRAATTMTVVTFTDADPNGTSSDYTASIAWGDGTISTGTITSTSSGFTVTGTHAYSATGNYTATATISDAGGSQATASAPVKVTSSGH